MAIQFISSNSTNTTTMTMPSHQAGDVLIMMAYRFGLTTATPAGWTELKADSSGYSRVAYKVAASSSETSGTWTNATTLVCMVYRNVYGIGQVEVITGDTSSAMSFPSMSLINTDGTSRVAMFGAIESYGVTWPTSTAAGYPRRQVHAPGGTDREAVTYDTNTGVASWSGDSINISNTQYKYTYSVELLDHAPPAPDPTIIGTNTSQTTSVTIPAHQIGDLIIIYAYRSSSNTLPSKPAAAGTVPAWTDIDAANGANTTASRTAYFVATATNHTSGTWTNATSMIAVVVRGQHSVVPIGAHAESGGTGTVMVAPAISMSRADGSSQVLHFFGGRSLSAWNAPQVGYTLATTTAASGASAALATKDVTFSAGAVNQGAQTSGTGYRGATVEILGPTTAIFNSAVGAGMSASFAGSGSWNHTASAGDTVIVDVYPDRGRVTGVTYGGTAMKKIGQINYAGGFGNGMFTRYIIFNVSSGTASVAFTLSGGAWVIGNSVSYQGAQSIDIPVTATGTGTALSQTATVGTDEMAVQSFGGASLTFSGHTGGTNRVRIGSGSTASLEINDASASDTFNSTLSSSRPWGGILSTLSPNAPSGVYYDEVGPGFTASIVTSGSFNHTATAGAYVVVDLSVDRANTVSSLTYDGTAMTLLGVANFTGASGNATLYRYGMANVAGGTKTISFTLTGGSAWVAGSSVSIMGVGAISGTTPVSGSNSSPTQGASCQPGQLIVQGFGGRAAFGTLTGGANLYDGLSGNSNVSQSISDRPTTFNASNSGLEWGSLVTVFGPSGSVFPPPPPYVVGSQMSNGTSVTLPAHQPGDLIIISAFHINTSTTPTKPAAGGTVPAWVDIDNNTGANNVAMRTAYFVATASNHTSGSWTGSTVMGAIVYRGVGVIPIGGHAESGGTGSGSVAPSITLSNSDGSSAILHIHANGLASLSASAPAGYTRRILSSGGYLAYNTKDDTTSDGSVTQDGGASSGYRGASIEIVGFNGPVFDALGAGANTASTSLSWSHTSSVGAYVFAAVELSNVASTVTVTACTYGGTAMTLLGSKRMNNDNTSSAGIVYLFGLASVPGGTKTVSVTLSGAAKALANSASYRGVTRVEVAQSVYGQGTSLSQAVTASYGQRIVQTFGDYPSSGSGALTPSGGFNRYNGTANSGASNLTISDTIVPTTFSATSSPTVNWSGISVAMSIYNGAFFPFL